MHKHWWNRFCLTTSVSCLVIIALIANVISVVTYHVSMCDPETVAGNICAIEEARHHVLRVVRWASILFPRLGRVFSYVYNFNVNEWLFDPLIGHFVKYVACKACAFGVLFLKNDCETCQG